MKIPPLKYKIERIEKVHCDLIVAAKILFIIELPQYILLIIAAVFFATLKYHKSKDGLPAPSLLRIG